MDIVDNHNKNVEISQRDNFSTIAKVTEIASNNNLDYNYQGKAYIILYIIYYFHNTSIKKVKKET
jgi:hypothetical protein